MKLKSTLLALGMMLPASVFATDYYIRTAANGTGDGSSWDNAMSFETFYNSTTINSYDTGDTFYFAGGKYVFPSVIGIKKGYNFIGGFSPELTGTENTLPTYPSATPTIFSGNKQLARILAITTPSTTNEPFKIQGIEFTEAFNSNYSQTQGALWFRDRSGIEVMNCRFYDNESTSASSDGMGGMALTAEQSAIKIVDCEFFNNRAGARGGAIRLADNDKKNGFTTIERCKIYNNSVKTKLGSAICVQHTQALNIVNTTIANNTAGTGNEAIYIGAPDNNFKRVLNIISSTIANNAGGNQVKMVVGNIANSIIVGCADAGSDVADAIAVTGGEAAIVSGGNNILETGDAAITTNATDVTLEKGSAYATVFGTNVLTDGVLVPVYKATGALADALATTVAEWGVEGVDLTVDQNGTVRGATVPGAVKADIKDAISSIEVADKADDAYYYTLSGIRVATPQKGIFIKNGKKVIIK